MPSIDKHRREMRRALKFLASSIQAFAINSPIQLDSRRTPLKFPASLRNLLSNLLCGEAFQSISPISITFAVYPPDAFSRRWHERNCAYVKRRRSIHGEGPKSKVYLYARDSNQSQVVSTIYVVDNPVWGKASFLLNRFFN